MVILWVCREQKLKLFTPRWVFSSNTVEEGSSGVLPIYKLYVVNCLLLYGTGLPKILSHHSHLQNRSLNDLNSSFEDYHPTPQSLHSVMNHSLNPKGEGSTKLCDSFH